MKRLPLLLALLTLLAGCASHWEHNTKRRSEFYSDDRECQIVSGGAAQPVEPGSNRISYESCMWERGWHKKQSFWFFEPGDN